MPSDSTFSSSVFINYPTTSSNSGSCGTITAAPPADWWTPDPVLTSIPGYGAQVPRNVVAAVPRKKGPIAIPVPQFEGLAMGSELLVFYKRNHPPGRYEEGHRHQGEVFYQNVRDLLARFFIKVHYESGPISNWREWCVGITSTIFRDNRGQRMAESTHMPMFDYDGKNIKSILRKDVQFLQKKWGLGAATIFQTKKGFHVYFMTDVVSWSSYWEMLNKVKCCEGFKRCALNNGYGVLRVSAKYSTFDIKKDSVMLPEKAKALPARKIRKAHVIEALLDLGMRCGTHFASLCSKWAQYHEDETPWKQIAKTKKTAAKAGLPLAGTVSVDISAPARDGIAKPKLILKLRRPGQLQPPVNGPGIEKTYGQECRYKPAFFYEPTGTHETSGTKAAPARNALGELPSDRPYHYVDYKRREQEFAGGTWEAEKLRAFATREGNVTTQPIGQAPEDPNTIKFESDIGTSVKATINKMMKGNF